MRVRIDGFDAAFDRTPGAGAPLVLVHGFPLDRTVWDWQSRALAGVIAPDLPGFGESALRPGPPSIDAYADAVGALLDRLDVERAVVGGVSMGGYVALAFARRSPERVKGLVLVDTRAGADSAEAKRGRDETAAFVRAHGCAALADRMLPKLLAPRSLRDAAPLAARLSEMIASQPREGVVEALAAMRDRPDSTELLAKIDVPTLVVAGAEDALIPPAESRAIADAVRGARLEIIPDAGHLPNYERPASFNDVVLKFLSSF